MLVFKYLHVYTVRREQGKKGSSWLLFAYNDNLGYLYDIDLLID